MSRVREARARRPRAAAPWSRLRSGARTKAFGVRRPLFDNAAPLRYRHLGTRSQFRRALPPRAAPAPACRSHGYARAPRNRPFETGPGTVTYERCFSWSWTLDGAL